MHTNVKSLYVNHNLSTYSLYFTKATEPQEVHDEYMQYVNDVHWYGANRLKSLYYLRSNAARNCRECQCKNMYQNYQT